MYSRPSAHSYLVVAISHFMQSIAEIEATNPAINGVGYPGYPGAGKIHYTITYQLVSRIMLHRAESSLRIVNAYAARVVLRVAKIAHCNYFLGC